MPDQRPIRVAVCGAKGKMGQEVVKAVLADSALALVGAVDAFGVGELVGPAVHIQENLSTMLQDAEPDVCVDFTHPSTVLQNTLQIIQAGCRPVIGTTGLDTAALGEIRQALSQKGLGGMVVPNFAIGAVLMMKFAQQASQYFEHAEIIELHHNQKADAPSGTALKTAELMTEGLGQGKAFGATNAPEKELLPGARGATGPANIHIHSVRLPGYVAHQEVLLGASGQVLTLRHDSLDRTCFMPGVVLAVKRVMTLTDLIYGLEHIL